MVVAGCMSTASHVSALAEAVEIAGSQTAFARICSVSQAAVWKWLQSNKPLPAEHVLTVERVTGVSKHLLRPDIYPTTDAVAPVSTADACDRHDVSQQRDAA
jgi:DNA-binding transcriptional regulator YdaS (Cro superfamily)